jgi:cyclohexanone monooxygenase
MAASARLSAGAAPRVAVLGAGPAGLAAGHELTARGLADFTIFEATDAVGGTWHTHSYPGLACDVWAHSYTFSYRPNPDWSASFVEGPEIEAYLQRCAREFGLESKIRLGTRIIDARWSEDGTWTLTSEDGRSFVFDAVISAMGNQHTPRLPDVPGLERFEGPSFHSTCWDHDAELAGRRVLVVGSAAAAVQIVPELTRIVSHLTVLQRTANWIMPRGRKPYSERRRRWNRRLPALMAATRMVQETLMSMVHGAVTFGDRRMEYFEKRALAFLERSVADAELRRALTPDTRYGCKRGLVSDDFYPALCQPHVELVAEALAEVRTGGVVTSSGREIPADAIVYCTGYRVLDFDRVDVRGRAGVGLAATMDRAPEAYLGIAAPDFPNWFFVAGPNGLVLSVPYFRSIERNIRSIVEILVQQQAAGVRAVSVRPDLCRAYNDWMAAQYVLYSWGNPSCRSYYRTDAGHAPFLFPGDFAAYRRRHETLSLADFATA